MTELSKGQALGRRFNLLSRLGCGGMAEVWLASDNESPQDEALGQKSLYAQLAEQREFIKRLNAGFEY